MNNFAYARALTSEGAIELKTGSSHAKFLGGGTNLVDLMREEIERPDMVIDVTRLPLAAIEELTGGGLRVGAIVKNSHLAGHPLVRERFSVLSQAILMGASAQLRNMATTGGNPMQRTRCYYFYDSASRCNKRSPGSGCDALDGFNRIHAILGTSPQCIATHPSDMCVALAALDAVVCVQSARRERRIPVLEFHRLPGDTPERDTNLEADELIVSIEIPPLPTGHRSLYRKVRDRASYAFALVSVAAVLTLEDGLIQDIRPALGGVAHKPWRCLKAESYLRGKKPGVRNSPGSCGAGTRRSSDLRP
jgi:xanthine dehydrogenase YagS FAD-binding subunit